MNNYKSSLVKNPGWILASFIMLLAVSFTLTTLANKSEETANETNSKSLLTGEWKMTYHTDDMPSYFKFNEEGLFYKTKVLNESNSESARLEQFKKGAKGVYTLKDEALELSFVNQANEILLPKAHGFNTISFTTKWFTEDEFKVFRTIDTPNGPEVFETVFSRISQK